MVQNILQKGNISFRWLVPVKSFCNTFVLNDFKEELKIFTSNSVSYNRKCFAKYQKKSILLQMLKSR